MSDVERFKRYAAALEDELKTVRKALEFYANGSFEGDGDVVFEVKDGVLQPIGTIARKALDYKDDVK